MFLKPIRFENMRRHVLGHKMPAGNFRKAMNLGATEGPHKPIENDRQPHAATLLRDVAYVVEAPFILAAAAKADDIEAKHLSMFNRRVAKGQCFHRPYLGDRECAADFALAERLRA